MTIFAAHARASDPSTSHAAAEAITGHLTDLQRKVSAYAKRCGPLGFTDAKMTDELDLKGSTLRTRRAELAEIGVIVDSGRRVTYGQSPRLRIVWVHRDFHSSPPDLKSPMQKKAIATEPKKPRTDQAEIDGMAAFLDITADDNRRRGFIGVEAELRKCAAYIRSTGI